MKSLYELAIKTFGADKQTDVAIEECSELIKAICKYRRGSEKEPAQVSHIAEEIADVQIMLEQLNIIFNCPNEVAIYRGAKLARLKDILEANIGGVK